MIFASQLPPRLVQHQRLEEQGADLVATGLTKLGCAISFGSQMDDIPCYMVFKMGIIFLLFGGTSVLLIRTCGRNETSRGAPPILSSVLNIIAQICGYFATCSLPIRYFIRYLMLYFLPSPNHRPSNATPAPGYSDVPYLRSSKRIPSLGNTVLLLGRFPGDSS